MPEQNASLVPANATRVRVLETNILHASDVIYWLDGSSAETIDRMARIEHPLDIRFEQKPAGMKVAHALGRTALWQIPDEPMHPGYANESQRTRPAIASFTVAGAVSDPHGRYNPRLFDLTMSGEGTALVLYPSPLGTRITQAGALHGTVRWADSEQAVPWALLSLSVELSPDNHIVFNGQADGRGDFILALTRLPPLPESVSAYPASLQISGSEIATGEAATDPEAMSALNTESAAETDEFTSTLALEIRAGENRRVNSFNKSYLAVQTA